MRRRAVVFVLLAMGAAGCDVCVSGRLPTCDIRQAGCQQQTQHLVACMRGASSSELPPISLMTTAELEEYLRAGGDPMMMRTLEWESALELLGLMTPGGDLLEASIQHALAGYAAFYSHVDKDIHIIDRGMPADSAEAVATLAHELVHAAQDEEFDLAAHLDAANTHEEVMLLNSLVEGEAMLYTMEAIAWSVGQRVNDVEWDAWFYQWQGELRSSLGTSSSPYLDIVHVLPYFIGGRWDAGAWERGGDDLVRENLHAPPESTVALMADPWQAASPLSPRVQTGCDAPPPPDGFALSQSDEMGPMLVYGFLFHFGMSHDIAWELASRWSRDDIHVYSAPDGRVALSWQIVFGNTMTPATIAAQVQGNDSRVGAVENTIVLLTSDDPTVTAAWTWTAATPVCAPPG